MELQRYQPLSPRGFAIAASCLALIAPLLAGFPMMGMMGGYRGQGMMWLYPPGHMLGFGIFWIAGALLAALAAAIFAWIYNAVSIGRADTSTRGAGSTPGVPAPR
jgi:hypothetical protein